MSSQTKQLTNTNGGMKRHHSIENLEPVKEAKLEKSNDTKSKEKTNDHNENKSDDEILEKGDIVFMYKPKLGVDEAASLDDVQLFHVLLIPEDEQTSKTRLVKIGKKKLPASGKDRFWAFIENADEDIEKVEEKNLEAQSYQTATVGTRTTKADRLAGKGKYIMAKHDQRRTVIGYVLESPTEIGQVQNAFNIDNEGSFSVAVKNPKTKSPPAAGLTQSQKAEFPAEVQQKFGSYQWLPAEPSMLDIPGCEMVWIGSSTDSIEELLNELNQEIDDNDQTDPETKATEIMKDIQLNENEHPIQPLIDGEWPKAEDAPEKNNDQDKQTKIDDYTTEEQQDK